MRVHFFDAQTERPDIIGPVQHGELGFDHCGSVPVDYPYQAEQWRNDIRDLEPSVIRCEFHDDSGVKIAEWKWDGTTWRKAESDGQGQADDQG